MTHIGALDDEDLFKVDLVDFHAIQTLANHSGPATTIEDHLSRDIWQETVDAIGWNPLDEFIPVAEVTSYCPTCFAENDQPCVTKFGKPTKRHKGRVG